MNEPEQPDGKATFDNLLKRAAQPLPGAEERPARYDGRTGRKIDSDTSGDTLDSPRDTSRPGSASPETTDPQ